MNVAGGYQPHVQLLGQSAQAGAQTAVAALVVALQLEEEIIAAKDGGKTLGDTSGAPGIPIEQSTGDFAPSATRQGDQALVMVGQPAPGQGGQPLLLIAARQRDQSAQVGIARLILGQQRQMPAAVDQR